MRKYFAWCILIFSILCAQQGTITGRVLDTTNKSPLIGANVVLEGTTQGTATDADGKYAILQVDPGMYTIMVSYIGYQVYKKDITVVD